MRRPDAYRLADTAAVLLIGCACFMLVVELLTAAADQISGTPGPLPGAP